MPTSETHANVMMRRRMCTWHFRNFCTGNTLQMAIYIRQALDAQKKALSQSLRLVSGEHSQNQTVAPPNARKKRSKTTSS